MPLDTRRFSARFLVCVIAALSCCAVVRTPAAADNSWPVYRFTFPNGVTPSSPLTAFSDGKFYGVTNRGGAGGTGTIVQVDPNTQAVVDAYDFSQTHGNTDGALPNKPLVSYKGSLFGVTGSGGSSSRLGTLFKFVPGSRTVGVLHRFVTHAGGGSDGHPNDVTVGPDGALYGTSPDGGTDGNGAFWRCDLSGQFTILHSFAKSGLEGKAPNAVMLYSDGNFYGTCSGGGQFNQGTYYAVTPAGAFRLLHAFTAPDGFSPNGRLVAGPGGLLYGSTATDGVNRAGTVFQATTNGLVITLAFFNPPTTGQTPDDLKAGPDGLLYGTTQSGGKSGNGVVFSLDPAHPAPVVLASLGFDTGANPAGLAFLPATGGPAPSFLIACANGGRYRHGSVVAVNGAQAKALYSFAAPDGIYPSSALYSGIDPAVPSGPHNQALFGTTASGGVRGHGIVFQLVPPTGGNDRAHIIDLYDFGTSDDDGAYPNESLIQDAGGVLYGTTEYGGSNDTGAVFALGYDAASKSWKRLWSVSFGPQDASNVTGAYPHCSLLLRNGLLIGSTLAGGTTNDGVLFTITTDGQMISAAHTFTLDVDGAGPNTLIADPSGALLYGTAQVGPHKEGYGTVFSYDLAADSLTVLHSFDYVDGAIPTTAVTFAATAIDSSPGPFLFGTTQYGGGQGLGTLFSVDLASKRFSSIYSFDGTTGASPTSPLLWQPPSGPALHQSSTRGGFLLGDSFGGGKAAAAAGLGYFRLNSALASGAVPTGGTLFAFSPSSTAAQPSVLTTFTGPNGSNPAGQIVAGYDGYYYGSTQYGGSGYGTIVQVAYPQIDVVTARSAAVNTDLHLSIYGSGFSHNARVIWNGGKTPITPSHTDPTRMDVTIPASENTQSGDISVQVFDPVPQPGGTLSNTATIQVP